MEQTQRHCEKPLQRGALTYVEDRCGIRIRRSGIAPVFIPIEQLNKCLRALHHIARIVQERSVASLGSIELFDLNPFEGFELGVETRRRATATGIGACV